MCSKWSWSSNAERSMRTRSARESLSVVDVHTLHLFFVISHYISILNVVSFPVPPLSARINKTNTQKWFFKNHSLHLSLSKIQQVFSIVSPSLTKWFLTPIWTICRQIWMNYTSWSRLFSAWSMCFTPSMGTRALCGTFLRKIPWGVMFLGIFLTKMLNPIQDAKWKDLFDK